VSADVQRSPATMEGDELDVELFINEVQKYPEIWNIKSEEYRDRNKKRTAWIKVCEVLCGNFNDKTEEEKNSIGK
jgi:hypothetical protein